MPTSGFDSRLWLLTLTSCQQKPWGAAGIAQAAGILPCMQETKLYSFIIFLSDENKFFFFNRDWFFTGNRVKGRRDTKRDLPSVCSVPKWLQQLGMGWTEARNQGFLLGSCVGGGAQELGPTSTAFLATRRELEGKWNSWDSNWRLSIWDDGAVGGGLASYTTVQALSLYFQSQAWLLWLFGGVYQWIQWMGALSPGWRSKDVLLLFQQCKTKGESPNTG